MEGKKASLLFAVIALKGICTVFCVFLFSLCFDIASSAGLLLHLERETSGL